MRQVARDIVIPFAVSRLVLVLVAWMAMSLFKHTAVPGTWEFNRAGVGVEVPTHVSPTVLPFTNMWSRWDAGWYLDIAQHGYKFTVGTRSNRAFFPVYPMLMRAARVILHSRTPATWCRSGILVSNAALLVTLLYVFALAKHEFDEATARRAVLYLLVFPTTFFFSAVYSESVFLALTVAAFYHARKGQWWLAGALACFATLSRPPGVVIAVALGTEYLLQCGGDWRRVRANAMAVFFAPIALLGFLSFLRYTEGSATSIVQAQGAWGLHLQMPWRTLAPFFHRGMEIRGTVIDLGFTVFFAALTVATAFRLRLSYVTFAFAYLVFITLWGSLESMPRYGLGLFPALLLLALWGRNEVFDRIYVPFSAALAALLMAAFAVWEWVA